MNLLILEDQQFISEQSAWATPRQSQHIASVLKSRPGDTIQVGKINGLRGRGTISELGERVAITDISLDTAPPPPLPLTLILAMPRPQMLKRILQTVATMGVETLVFLQTSRVEKSFWQSPSASEQAMREQLILGLEQGMVTHMPKVLQYRRFIPFVEDELQALSRDRQCLIAHPNTPSPCTELPGNSKITLAIGPEGGFLKKEVDKFLACGFSGIHLGQRILKVETAVPVLLSKLFAFS